MISRLAAIYDWIVKNWGPLTTLAVLIAGLFHLRLEIRKGAPGSDPSIVIIIPEDTPKVIRGANPQTGQRIVNLVKTLAVDPVALERAEEAAANASITIK